MTALKLFAIILLTVLAINLSQASAGYQGLLLAPEKKITPYQMVDQDGHDTVFPSVNGKFKLVFFGYTSCPDICPTTMHKVSRIIKATGLGKKVDFVFISIDADRDKPEYIKSFLNYFHPDIKGLSGSIQSIKKIEQQFGILTRKFQGKSAFAYTLEHSVFMYLLNQQGNLILMYPGSVSTDQVVSDLNTLTKK